MPLGERCLNFAFGLSVFSWGVLGLLESRAEDQFGVVRVSIAALNFTVGALFILRSPVAVNASPAQVLVCLPSLVVAGWAFNTTSPLNEWPAYATAIFATGAVIAIVSFLRLGRNFSVLPALRTEIVTGGSFRLLRHPAYAGELMMIVACGVAAWSISALLPVIFAVPLVVTRILAEEQTLFQDAAYARYASAVRWRLLPGIW